MLRHKNRKNNTRRNTKNNIKTIQITTRVKRTLAKHNNSSRKLIGMLFRWVSDLCCFFFIHSHQSASCVCFWLELHKTGVCGYQKRVLTSFKWLEPFFLSLDVLLFTFHCVYCHRNTDKAGFCWMCSVVHISNRCIWVGSQVQATPRHLNYVGGRKYSSRLLELSLSSTTFFGPFHVIRYYVMLLTLIRSLNCSLELKWMEIEQRKKVENWIFDVDVRKHFFSQWFYDQ